ncbi:MAG: hypothetical protein KAS32_01000 [Candidatus Peribacteraceae bacterium]|nr:hypothetical protein [Candidatus Peribacteraceae bacterium]
MAISSSCLFHFTKSKENLLNILTNEFQPRYCLENFHYLLPKSPNINYEVALPMVCFCDLPLSNIKEHLEFYGDYGIGLTKEWGQRNGLNPIIYLSKNSLVCKYLQNSLTKAHSPEDFINIFELMSYTKPCKGETIHNGKSEEKNFYDEREWRYAPNVYHLNEKDKKHKYRIDKSEYLDPTKLAHYNKLLESEFTLSFEPDDINYIIVKDHSEIYPMINAIRDIKTKYDLKTKEILSTKIITSSQIQSDF